MKIVAFNLLFVVNLYRLLGFGIDKFLLFWDDSLLLMCFRRTLSPEFCNLSLYLMLISWFLPRKTYWLLVYRSGFVAVSHLCTGVQKARQLCQLGVGAEHCFLTPDKWEILKSTFSLPLKCMKYERLSPPPWKI